MEDIRSHHSLDNGVVNELNKYPQIDYLRSQVTDQDIELIFDMANSDREELRKMAYSLLRGAEKNERVRSFIHHIWSEASDYQTKYHIMWRLLDYPDLDISLHESIYGFVEEHWDQWISDTTAWYGGPDAVLEAVRHRLSDRSFPASKAWAYLCVSIGSSDKEQAKSLLSEYAGSTASIVSEVVEDLRKRLA